MKCLPCLVTGAHGKKVFLLATYGGMGSDAYHILIGKNRHDALATYFTKAEYDQYVGELEEDTRPNTYTYWLEEQVNELGEVRELTLKDVRISP